MKWPSFVRKKYTQQKYKHMLTNSRVWSQQKNILNDLNNSKQYE